VGARRRRRPAEGSACRKLALTPRSSPRGRRCGMACAA
jgi:hypothetical protein